MIRNLIQTSAILLLAACIPGMLMLHTWQSKQFIKLQNDVKQLNARQYELIEVNNRLITNISILSSPERIEQLARDVLHMRKANPDEIIRIEVKGKKVDG